MSATLFIDEVIKRRPFIPPHIYESCMSLERAVVRLKAEFEKTFEVKEDRIDWRIISGQNTELQKIAEELNQRIRDHIYQLPNQRLHSIAGSARSE